MIVANSYLSYVSANLMGGGARRASAQTAASAQMPQSQSSHLLLSRASLQVCRRPQQLHITSNYSTSVMHTLV